MTTQWNIYLNGKWIDKIGGDKRALKDWVKRNVLSTHMGRWVRRTEKFEGYEYETTIGAYYEFKREIRGES